MLNETSQAVKEKIPYDLIYKWNPINKTSKQNTTRDIEIKNNLAVTRGERRRGIIGMGSSGNMYEGYMDKAKGSVFGGGRRGWVGWGVDGVKMETIVLEQQ